MQRRGRKRRQEVLQKIRRLDANAAQIRQPGAATFAVQFLDATEETFDTDEIHCRVPAGVFNEERAVAAAEFDFQRLRLLKKFRQDEPLDNGTQLDNQIFLIVRVNFQIRRRQSEI